MDISRTNAQPSVFGFVQPPSPGQFDSLSSFRRQRRLDHFDFFSALDGREIHLLTNAERRIVGSRLFSHLESMNQQEASLTKLFAHIGHTRAEHSIGACVLVGMVCARNLGISSGPLYTAMRMAALLHDVGHLHSHGGEAALASIPGLQNHNHEQATVDLIAQSRDLKKIVGDETVKLIVKILTKDGIPYSGLGQVIELVERCDYLVRDLTEACMRPNHLASYRAQLNSLLSNLHVVGQKEFKRYREAEASDILVNINGTFHKLTKQETDLKNGPFAGRLAVTFPPAIEDMLRCRQHLYTEVSAHPSSILVQAFMLKAYQRAFSLSKLTPHDFVDELRDREDSLKLFLSSDRKCLIPASRGEAVPVDVRFAPVITLHYSELTLKGRTLVDQFATSEQAAQVSHFPSCSMNAVEFLVRQEPAVNDIWNTYNSLMAVTPDFSKKENYIVRRVDKGKQTHEWVEGEFTGGFDARRVVIAAERGAKNSVVELSRIGRIFAERLVALELVKPTAKEILSDTDPDLFSEYLHQTWFS